jgi:hypothetical protein
MGMNKNGPPEPVISVTEPISTAEGASRNSLASPAVVPMRLDERPASHLRPSFELQIDELVLHGFGTRQRYAIQDAVERELTRLLVEHGSPTELTRDVEIAYLKGGEINVSPESNGETTGIQLARIIYGGLGQ